MNRHLLWPRLTSDDPSRRLSTPVALWQTTRPPRVRRATFPLMPVGCTSWRFVQVPGVGDRCHLTPPGRLISASCSSGQRFASGFLQILPRGRHPCRRLALPLTGRAGDFHPQVILRHHPQEQRLSRRYAPCLAHNKNTRLLEEGGCSHNAAFSEPAYGGAGGGDAQIHEHAAAQTQWFAPSSRCGFHL